MKLVIYKRVSTQEQNKSGLGLSAQDSDIEYKIKQLKSKYKNVEVIDNFVEIESGSTTTLRPKLIYAIAKCKKEGAYLLVQKIDRLSRNIRDGITIFEELKKNVLFADLDTNDSMVIAIMLAQAQKEREMISLRTKKALAQLKKKGAKLGRPYKKYKNHKIIKGQNQYAISQMNKARNDKHSKYYEHVIKWVCDYRNKGDSYLKIANMLNDRGYITIRQKQFNASTVRNLYKRYC